MEKLNRIQDHIYAIEHIGYKYNDYTHTYAIEHIGYKYKDYVYIYTYHIYNLITWTYDVHSVSKDIIHTFMYDVRIIVSTYRYIEYIKHVICSGIYAGGDIA